MKSARLASCMCALALLLPSLSGIMARAEAAPSTSAAELKDAAAKAPSSTTLAAGDPGGIAAGLELVASQPPWNEFGQGWRPSRGIATEGRDRCFDRLPGLRRRCDRRRGRSWPLQPIVRLVSEVVVDAGLAPPVPRCGNLIGECEWGAFVHLTVAGLDLAAPA